jgi:hypothetical protein
LRISGATIAALAGSGIRIGESIQTANMQVGANLTSGLMDICIAGKLFTSTSLPGTINIGTGSATGHATAVSEASGCVMNIGTVTRIRYSNINIGTGSRDATSLINIGTGADVSGDINIGTGARNYGDVNILTGANATGKLVVGGDASLNGNLRVQRSIAINKDISSQYVLDVNGISQFRGNVDVGGSFTINGVAVSANNLSGNVQVGTDNGYVTVDKPQFYSDPSLFIYYNFDTSYNNGSRIYNSGFGGSTYDASLNANPGTSTTLGVIDTSLFKYGGASLKNDPNTPNNHGAFTYNVPISTKMSVSFWINKKSIASLKNCLQLAYSFQQY